MRISLPEGPDHALALVTPTSGAPPGNLAADHEAGRRAVQLALAAVLEAHERKVIVRRRPGRPPLALLAAGSEESPRHLPHALSVAHVDGHAAAVVAPAGWRVGVDLERDDAIREEYRRYFLAGAEREALSRYTAAECWALKEAAWKALELRGEAAFADLTLRVDAVGGVTSVAVRGVEHAARARLARPWAGFVLAALWIPAPERAAGDAVASAVVGGIR